jgi:serine O-acetyltransferase
MSYEISATEPDWSRERIRGFWNRGRRLTACMRGWQAARRRGGPIGWVSGKFWGMQYRLWSVLTQSEIAPRTQVAGGFFLPHPTGIVIHPDSRIGPNCTIFQQVTLGTSKMDGGAPVLEGDVMIGAGARILGGVTIGAHARIGANAVVLKDVPAGASAVGIPARIIEKAPTGDPA